MDVSAVRVRGPLAIALALFVVVSTTVLVPAGVAAQQLAGRRPPQSSGYQHPIDAPISDPFHMNNGPFGAGNRGIEYLVRGGEPVAAPAAGIVTFAGPVVGRLVVSIDHADGNRSSLTNLESIAQGVEPGRIVFQGETIGTAGRGLHFGVRVAGHYIDPASLIGRPRRGHAYLVKRTANRRH